MDSNNVHSSGPRADMMASLTMCTARTSRSALLTSRKPRQTLSAIDVQRSIQHAHPLARRAAVRDADAASSPAVSSIPSAAPHNIATQDGVADLQSTVVADVTKASATPRHTPVPLSSTNRMFPSMVPCRLPTASPHLPQAAGRGKPAIVWFRNDLRIHDNEPLVSASTEGSSLMPVYCFDPRDVGPLAKGYDRSGPYRARFLIAAVSELRQSLRQLGSDLVVRVGHPEEVLPKLAAEVGAGVVYCHAEVTDVDMQMDRAIRCALHKLGAELKTSWSNSLLHPDDLPFALQQTPMQYGKFQQGAAGVRVRTPVDTPRKLKGLPRAVKEGEVQVADMLTMEGLGYSRETVERCEEDCNVVAGLKGGETQGLQQLQQRLSDIARHLSNPLAPPPNLSVELNPWVVTGCLSLRRIHQALTSHLTALGQHLPHNWHQMVQQPVQHHQCHRRQQQEVQQAKQNVLWHGQHKDNDMNVHRSQPATKPQRHGQKTPASAEQYMTAFHWREFFRCLNRKFSVMLAPPAQRLDVAVGELHASPLLSTATLTTL